MDAHNTLTNVTKHELELDGATCISTTCTLIKDKEVIFQTNCNKTNDIKTRGLIVGLKCPYSKQFNCFEINIK